MKKKLQISLNKDEKLLSLILKTKFKIIIKRFIYDVRILKIKYIQMIRDRYISTLLNFNNKQIISGINEVKNDYGNVLKFKDRLICLIIKKN